MFIPATVLVPEYVATTWCHTPVVTAGVSANAKVLSPLLNRPRFSTGPAEPGSCISAQPAFPPTNFDSSVPAEFDMILNQPDMENTSVHTNLILSEWAGLASLFPANLILLPISPGCCWLASTVPF